MSTAIQISGLASGIDWSSLITSIITADRTPETQWKTQESTNNDELTAWTGLGTQLTALQTSVQGLQESSVFTAHSTTPSNAALGWTTSAGPNTPNGVYAVDVSRLASASALQGTSNVGAALSATSDVSGLTIGTLPTATAVTAGNFQIDGTSVAVAATDSLQDVFNKINTATGGNVTASYDPNTDKVSLQSANGSPIVLGASNDTTNFLTALGLNSNGTANVSSANALGATQLDEPIASSHLLAAIGNTDAGGNGSFQINGVSIAYNVGTDSLQSVLNKINGSTAGVTAAYDASNDRFTLTNSTTGNLGLSATETGSGLLAAMGLGSSATVSSGLDATYSVNGGATQTSHSNTFTDASGLSVTASTLGTQSITVGTDATAATSAINDFIAKFNAIETTITQDTTVQVNADNTVTSAVFAGNQDVTDLGKSLRSLVFGAVQDVNGSGSTRLQDMGIDFVSGTSTLAVTNSTALANALSTNGANVANLFQNSTNGLVTQLQKFITTTTGTSGAIATATTTLNTQNATLANQTAALERQLAAEQTSLTNEFTAMEQIEAQMKNEAQELTNAFGGSSGITSTTSPTVNGGTSTSSTAGTSTS